MVYPICRNGEQLKAIFKLPYPDLKIPWRGDRGQFVEEKLNLSYSLATA
jgi:hypothetical protein